MIYKRQVSKKRELRVGSRPPGELTLKVKRQAVSPGECSGHGRAMRRPEPDQGSAGPGSECTGF